MADKKLYTVTLQLPNGTRKYFRGKTQKEAEKKRDEAKVKVGMGVDISCRQTVKEFSDMWFNLYKKGTLHKRSEETIRNTLTRYIIPVLGNMQVVDVKPIHIQQLMSSVKDYSNSTQKKVLQYTRAIFEVAVENSVIPKNPVSKSIKAGGAAPKEKVPLTKQQADDLLKAVEGTRAHLLVMVLLNAGLRIGEALGLMWTDIDFNEGTLTVNRSIVYPEENRMGEINDELKTENAHRTIPLPWSVIEELRREQSKSQSLWVFPKLDGNHHSYDSYRKLWELIDRRTTAKRKDDRRELVARTLDFSVHPHLLRHTCVTRWFEQGLDIKEIQYLAGHATVDITLEIYTHYMNKERGKRTAEKIRAAV